MNICLLDSFTWVPVEGEGSERKQEGGNAFSLTELTRGILPRQICILLWSITLLLFSSFSSLPRSVEC